MILLQIVENARLTEDSKLESGNGHGGIADLEVDVSKESSADRAPTKDRDALMTN